MLLVICEAKKEVRQEEKSCFVCKGVGVDVDVDVDVGEGEGEKGFVKL